MKFTFHKPACYFCQQPLQITDDEANHMHSTFYKGHDADCFQHSTHPVFHRYYQYSLLEVESILNDTLQLKVSIKQNKLFFITYNPLINQVVYAQDLTVPISYEECNKLLNKIVKMKAFL